MTSSISKHKKWAHEIKNRDKKCTKCGSSDDLVAHHLLSWCKFPELRFDLSNGITLCQKCHKSIKKKVVENKTQIDYTNLVMTDITFNRWTLSTLEIRIKSNYYIVCKCRCGTIRKVNKSCVLLGKSKSCGCLQKEITSSRCSGNKNPQFKHGQSCRKNGVKNIDLGLI